MKALAECIANLRRRVENEVSQLVAARIGSIPWPPTLEFFAHTDAIFCCKARLLVERDGRRIVAMGLQVEFWAPGLAQCVFGGAH